jgi:hypothetical protein
MILTWLMDWINQKALILLAVVELLILEDDILRPEGLKSKKLLRRLLSVINPADRIRG